ncbi:hypothetical protein Tco_0758263 [Tanacetum coccineum]
MIQASLPTSTATVSTSTTTTTSLPPIPPQLQQGSSDLILIQRICELKQHMADMVEANQALEERLDKQGNGLYNLENLDIPHKVSKVVDEIVTDAVAWTIQAPLRDHFRDLLEADMKEILHHRMWEFNSYQSHEDHKMLKNKKRHASSKTPPGSPPYQPPPPPPPAGPSRTSGASRSSQLPPPPPPPPSTNRVISLQASLLQALQRQLLQLNIRLGRILTQDSSCLSHQFLKSYIWKMIRLPTNRQNWWKPLTEDRPATPEPAWSIPSSDLPVPVNNWASALASTYAPPPENSLLAQTGDMAIFMDWFCKKQGITELKQQDLEGPAYEIVKVFHPNVIHLQYQMEECHKLLTDQVDESIIRYNVSKPLPLGGPPGQVTIQSDFFFNKDLEYLRYGRKSGRPALSILKMKTAYYPDVGLEQMVPDQM